MAEDDIYGSKSKYENFVKNLSKVLIKPKNGVYYCKNKKNVKYFKKLSGCFEAKDLSYIRRNKVFYNLRIITFATNKDLKDCGRDEVNKIADYLGWKIVTEKKESRVCLIMKEDKDRLISH